MWRDLKWRDEKHLRGQPPSEKEDDWIADRILQAAEREASFHSGRTG